MCGVMRTRACDHNGSVRQRLGLGDVEHRLGERPLRARHQVRPPAAGRGQRAPAPRPAAAARTALRSGSHAFPPSAAAGTPGSRCGTGSRPVPRRRQSSARRRSRRERLQPARSKRNATSCVSTACPSEPSPSTPTRRSVAVFTGSACHSALLRAPVCWHVAVQVEHCVGHVLDHAATMPGSIMRTTGSARQRGEVELVDAGAGGKQQLQVRETARRCPPAAPRRRGSARAAGHRCRAKSGSRFPAPRGERPRPTAGRVRGRPCRRRPADQPNAWVTIANSRASATLPAPARAPSSSARRRAAGRGFPATRPGRWRSRCRCA